MAICDFKFKTVISKMGSEIQIAFTLPYRRF
jgi:hypothetical protein